MTDIADDATARTHAIHRVMSLEEARAEVDGWLDEVKLKTGKCSQLMRNQLAEHMRHRTQSVFSIYDEIGQIEQTDPPRRTGTKPAAPLKRELAGLMHKHYKVSSLASFALNQLNHWERKANQPKLAESSTSSSRMGTPGSWPTNLSLVPIRDGTARIR